MVGVGLGQRLGGVEPQVDITGLGHAPDDGDWSLEAPLQQLGREGLRLGLHVDAGGGRQQLLRAQLGQLVAPLGPRHQGLVGLDRGGDGPRARPHPLTVTDDLTGAHAGGQLVHRAGLHLDGAQWTHPDLTVLHAHFLRALLLHCPGALGVAAQPNLEAGAPAAVLLLAAHRARLEPLD